MSDEQTVHVMIRPNRSPLRVQCATAMHKARGESGPRTATAWTESITTRALSLFGCSCAVLCELCTSWVARQTTVFIFTHFHMHGAQEFYGTHCWDCRNQFWCHSKSKASINRPLYSHTLGSDFLHNVFIIYFICSNYLVSTVAQSYCNCWILDRKHFIP